MSIRRFQQSLTTLQRKNRLLAIEDLENIAKLDVGRETRKGLPEIILAEGKEPEDVARIAEAMVRRTRRAIISRADKRQYRAIRSKLRGGASIEYKRRSKLVLVKAEGFKVNQSGGRVGILTAGTSDIPVAEEAETVAGEMGCETRSYNDVGVAGLHRLFRPLKQLMKWDADVILVIAGREGALPTVVTGLVDIPVIGVPTSRSYGFGEKGLAALAAMLQSCSLGMSVVNIDGGVGAGAAAALIANRAGKLRRSGYTRERRG